MIYQQLTRVDELDTEITNLHQLLNNLYSERAQLISKPVTSVEKNKLLTPTKPDELYEQFKQAWGLLDVKLPGFKTLQPQLRAACQRKAELVQSQPAFDNRLQLVLVPPTNLLEQAAAKSLLKFQLNDMGLPNWPNDKGWQVIIVMDAAFNVPVMGLAACKASKFFGTPSTQVASLGMIDIVAAELQGCQIILPNRWTILLKESPKDQGVICATREENSIVFDVDDTDCLLGDNHITLAERVIHA